MRFTNSSHLAWMPLFMLLAVVAVGCGQQSDESSEAGESAQVADASHEGHDHDGEEADHSHDGWWCVEHGVPEDECSMCSTKAADDFKAKGDWCSEHARAESQCFKCDPTRAEKFAKLYEAKFGHAPPKPTD